MSKSGTRFGSLIKYLEVPEITVKQVKRNNIIKKESIKQYNKQRYLEILTIKVKYQKAMYQENSEVRLVYKKCKYQGNPEIKMNYEKRRY